MTRARKDDPKPAEKDRKPKLSRETVKDLDPKRSEDVKGGAVGQCSGAASGCSGT